MLVGKLTLSILIWRITMATRNTEGRDILIATIQYMLLRFIMSHEIIRSFTNMVTLKETVCMDVCLK